MIISASFVRIIANILYIVEYLIYKSMDKCKWNFEYYASLKFTNNRISSFKPISNVLKLISSAKL